MCQSLRWAWVRGRASVVPRQVLPASVRFQKRKEIIGVGLKIDHELPIKPYSTFLARSARNPGKGVSRFEEGTRGRRKFFCESLFLVDRTRSLRKIIPDIEVRWSEIPGKLFPRACWQGGHFDANGTPIKERKRTDISRYGLLPGTFEAYFEWCGR
ncbi:MAG: hypothetical protein BMS9Abin05_2301 [Rhodothermia bacterium]|nr:MAG: hypothetical protein BMS9Abin05_2301 [Rhodothermia bacterium]